MPYWQQESLPLIPGFPDSLSSLLWLTQHKREHPARLQTDPDNWVDCVSTPSHVESGTLPQCRPSVEDAGPALRQRFHTRLTQPEGCVSYLGSPGGTVRAADRAVFPEAFWISGAGGSEHGCASTRSHSRMSCAVLFSRSPFLTFSSLSRGRYGIIWPIYSFQLATGLYIRNCVP